MSGMVWDKWFWSDFDADEGLRICSLAAQGLWWRMLSLMARAAPKGELRIGGEPCTVEDLSRSVGVPEETVAALLGELERRGVFSRTRTGVIFNRKMRKGAEISAKRARAGAKGAATTNLRIKENPDLPRQNSSNDAGKPSSKKPAPETRNQSSVTNVTGEPPPEIDPVKALFDLGVSLLTAAGSSDREARTMVGKWRKQQGDEATSAALIAARDKSDPVAWIQARFARAASQTDDFFASIDRKYG